MASWSSLASHNHGAARGNGSLWTPLTIGISCSVLLLTYAAFPSAQERAVWQLPTPKTTLPVFRNTLDVMFKHGRRLVDWLLEESRRHNGKPMTGKELGPMPSKSSSASLESPGSRSFSSEPVAPVVASSHSRRNNAEMSWRMAGHGEEHDSMNNRVQAGQMAASSSGGSSHAASPSNSSYRDDRSDGSQVTSDDEMRGPTRGNANAAAASSNSAASNEGGGGGTSAPTNKRGMHFRSQSPDGSDSDTASENGGSSTAQRRVLPSLAVPSAGNSGQQQKHPADDERRSGRNPNGSAWTNGNRPPKNGDSPDTAGYPVGQEEDPPSPDDQDVKIMFHGREVYADDLIGLRVAKTFVGHGRFLGQVVKFDDASQLYTVVYADGDAEELSVENTIQVLIQDEIERADPTAPPVTINYRKDRPQAPDSPTTASAGQSFAPPAPVHQAPLQQLDRPEKISELEAQFMVGLFENHAVPELLRKGWKIQTSTNGTEQRFVAPPGNFPGAGRCFNSALEVIEMIASDAAMLDACFPKNVHQAITSVFSGTSRESRKRSQSAPGEAEYYDPKRPRSARGSPRDAHLPAALPGRGHGQDERSFGLDGREREREHDGHLGHRIVAPSAGQYAGGPQRLPQVYTESRTLSHDSGDLRRPVSDIRGGLTAPLRPLSQNGTPPPRSWSANSHTPPVDNGDYRRPFPEAEWRNRDGFGSALHCRASTSKRKVESSRQRSTMLQSILEGAQQSSLIVTTLLVASVFVGGFYVLVRRRRQRDAYAALPRPPSTLPVLGNLIDLMFKQRLRIHDWFSDMCAMFEGRHWLLSSPGRVPTVVLGTVDAYEDTLKHHFDSFAKNNGGVSTAEDFFGNGIFVADGADWVHQRKTASHLFSLNMMRDIMESVIANYAAVLCDKLERAAQSDTTVDFKHLMGLFATDVFTRIGFGVDMGCLRGDHPDEFFA
ncbi:TPA: hypothetical protein N0F65_006652, partial [Lagenidium giganteum]